MTSLPEFSKVCEPWNFPVINSQLISVGEYNPTVAQGVFTFEELQLIDPSILNMGGPVNWPIIKGVSVKVFPHRLLMPRMVASADTVGTQFLQELQCEAAVFAGPAASLPTSGLYDDERIIAPVASVYAWLNYNPAATVACMSYGVDHHITEKVWSDGILGMPTMTLACTIGSGYQVTGADLPLGSFFCHAMLDVAYLTLTEAQVDKLLRNQAFERAN